MFNFSKNKDTCEKFVTTYAGGETTGGVLYNLPIISSKIKNKKSIYNDVAR